jgi:hypothetical protein
VPNHNDPSRILLTGDAGWALVLERRPKTAANESLLSRDWAIQCTVLAFEIRLEVIDAFAGQPVEADRIEHWADGPAGSRRRRKSHSASWNASHAF